MVANLPLAKQFDRQNGDVFGCSEAEAEHQIGLQPAVAEHLEEVRRPG